MKVHDKPHHATLRKVARKAMIERGLLPDFSAEVIAELGRIQAPAAIRMSEESVKETQNKQD